MIERQIYMKYVYVFVTQLFLFYCLTNAMKKNFQHLTAIQAFADSGYENAKVVTDDMPKELKKAIVRESQYAKDGEFVDGLERHAIALRKDAHAKAKEQIDRYSRNREFVAQQGVAIKALFNKIVPVSTLQTIVADYYGAQEYLKHHHTFIVQSLYVGNYSPVARFTFSSNNRALTVYSANVACSQISNPHYNLRSHRGFERPIYERYGYDIYTYNLDTKKVDSSTHKKPRFYNDCYYNNDRTYNLVFHWPVDEIVCQLSHDGIYYAYADNKGNTEQAHFPNKLQIHVYKKVSANALQEMLKDNDKTQAVAVLGSDNTDLANAIQRVYPMPNNLSSERDWFYCIYGQ